MEAEWAAMWRKLQSGEIESTCENWQRCAELMHDQIAFLSERLAGTLAETLEDATSNA